MQAVLDSTSLKHLTRALTCLSRYGDELTVYATPDHLSLSATNSSMSAYCRFKYNRQFFTRYTVENTPTLADVNEVIKVSGQLLVKSLLSILKHKTVEKSADKCELSIALPRGAASREQANEDNEEDTLESKLTVRLHCKHGVIKTHRLLLNNADALMAPSVPDSPNESRLTIGPRALRDMLDHFPSTRGPKSDPQLIWTFSEDEVILKGFESSFDPKLKGQLATELTISAQEFEAYEIYDPPITIAFHLREFMATIGFAEPLALALDLRFTDPAAPLFIDVEGDLSETLFVISTSQVHGSHGGIAGANVTRAPDQRRSESVQPQQGTHPIRGRKRGLEEGGSDVSWDHTPQINRAESEIGIASSNGRAMSAIVSESRAGSVSARGSPVPVHQGGIPPSARKKSMKAVMRTHPATLARELGQSQKTAVLGLAEAMEAMGPPHTPVPKSSLQPLPPPSSFVLPPSSSLPTGSMPPPASLPRLAPSQTIPTGSRDKDEEPLFLPLPPSQLTQLSPVASQAIIDSGLGIENMNMQEFEEMMECDEDEFELEYGDGNEGVSREKIGVEEGEKGAQEGSGTSGKSSSFNIWEEELDAGETQFGPSQGWNTSVKTFKPLFDD